MLRFRRVRTAAPVGAFAVALGLVTGPADPVAEAAPRSFTIVGGGYGHGIGMSRYGAHGMALRGASAGRIISFYYGGAGSAPPPPGAPATVTWPATGTATAPGPRGSCAAAPAGT
jgi:hypothetical protein